MDVSITYFRKHLFDLANQALDGNEIWVTHRGQRFRLAPEAPAQDRLNRITPLQIIHPDASDSEAPSLQQEMVQAWEQDWASL